MNLYEMKLGENFWSSEMNCNILRVPGGWVFQSTFENQDAYSTQCFVPFNNEFMEITDTVEAVKQPPTKQGRLEDSAQICPHFREERYDLTGEGTHFELVGICRSSGKLLPC